MILQQQLASMVSVVIEQVQFMAIRLLRLALLLAAAVLTVNYSPLFATSQGTEIIGGDYDFGYVPYGQTITHNVKLVNHTDSTLRILHGVPGCGCTRLIMPQRVAAPEETLTIEIQLDLSKMSHGRFIKSPTVMVSDPAVGRLSIHLNGFSYRKGDISSQVRVVPEVAEFAEGQTEMEVEIRNIGSRPFQVIPLTYPDKTLFAVTLPAVPIGAGKAEKVKFKLQTANNVQGLRDYLTFKLTDEKSTRFTIPITAGK